MAKTSEHLGQITRNAQWTEQILLSLDIDTAEQHTARETALKNIAEWLKTDIHDLRKTFEVVEAERKAKET